MQILYKMNGNSFDLCWISFSPQQKLHLCYFIVWISLLSFENVKSIFIKKLQAFDQDIYFCID